MAASASSSAPSGSAAYKKRDGVLAMADDHRSVTWTPKTKTKTTGSGSGPGPDDAEGSTIWVRDITSTKFSISISIDTYHTCCVIVADAVRE